MLDKDRVFALFLLFSDLSDASGGRWRSLCDNAADALENRLRKDVVIAAAMERLCTAAAACAYADYLALDSGAFSGDDVRVGDISISAAKSGANGDADELREYFMIQIADLLAHPSVLKRVEVEHL